MFYHRTSHLYILAPSCFNDNFNIILPSKPVSPTWSLCCRLSYQNRISHVTHAHMSSHAILLHCTCTEQMCTYNQRSLLYRHVKVCPVFRGESMLKCQFLIQDPRSDLTIPYHLFIVVLKIFYWHPFFYLPKVIFNYKFIKLCPLITKKNTLYYN